VFLKQGSILIDIPCSYITTVKDNGVNIITCTSFNDVTYFEILTSNIWLLKIQPQLTFIVNTAMITNTVDCEH